MAIYHFHLTSLSRTQGRSATAAAAYRAGVAITDARTGERHDYSRRSGVLHAEIATPEGTPRPERSVLWNVVEQAERRKDAKVAREIVVALPHELGRERATQLAVDYAQGLAERAGWAVDVAVHAPHREGDARNLHAHLLCTTRRWGCEGLGAKTRDWDLRQHSGALMDRERTEWARAVNQALERVRAPARVDGRSHRARGSGLLPQVHLGPAASALERQGRSSERGELNRAIARHNRNVVELDRAQHLVQALQVQRGRERALPDDLPSLESLWRAETAQRFGPIQARAARAAKRAEAILERQRERLEAHQKARPAAPRVLIRWRQAGYLRQLDAWQAVQAQLHWRWVQLTDRLHRIEAYGREGLRQYGGYLSQGERLAERQLARERPDLARKLQQAREQERTRQVEGLREALAKRRGRDRGRGYER